MFAASAFWTVSALSHLFYFIFLTSCNVVQSGATNPGRYVPANTHTWKNLETWTDVDGHLGGSDQLALDFTHALYEQQLTRSTHQ